MPVVDYEMTIEVHERLKKDGVALYEKTMVRRIFTYNRAQNVLKELEPIMREAIYDNDKVPAVGVHSDG